MKHTPGPWKFGGMNTRHVFGPDGHAICTLAAFEDRISLGKGTVKANARLIAAAPDMLDTIQRLVEQIECQGFINQHEGAKAKALIVKITGRG